jgi:SOS response regulatory protein OraA/RecX
VEISDDARDDERPEDEGIGEAPTAAGDAVELALAALRYRDLSEQELERKLEARGIGEEDRSRAVETLRRTALLDERRFAQGRAEALASRGAGDALVRDSLRRAGVPREVVEDVIAGLEPEAERARPIVARRGVTARTARYLAGKGFSPESIGAVVASEVDDALG